MSAANVKKVRASAVTEWIKNVVKDTIEEVKQVEYMYAKEGMKLLIF